MPVIQWAQAQASHVPQPTRTCSRKSGLLERGVLMTSYQLLRLLSIEWGEWIIEYNEIVGILGKWKALSRHLAGGEREGEHEKYL